MSKRTEYQELKRYLFAVKDYTNRLTAIDANSMIQDACVDALDKMDEAERMVIERQCRWLVDNAKDSGQRLGERGALETLAAIGDYLNGCGSE